MKVCDAPDPLGLEIIGQLRRCMVQQVETLQGYLAHQKLPPFRTLH